MIKKRIVFSCVVCTIIMLLFIAVGCAVKSSPDSAVSSEPADLSAMEQDALKSGIAENEEGSVPAEDLFTKSYRIASEDQKARLDNIQKEDFLGAVGTYTKQIKIIMNELPETVPNITKAQAIDICSEVNVEDYASADDFEYDITQRFNEIAGAPDFEGGSGFRRIVYFIDDAHSKYIIIRLGNVEYVDNETDECEVILEGTLSTYD